MRALMIAATVLACSSAISLAEDSALDVAAGEQVFRRCSTCHAIGEGAKTRIGPVLNGLDGRKAGTVEGFAYSAANRNANVTWSAATFKAYIKNPQAVIPGTKKGFAGLRDEREIDNLWAYLAQFGPDGKKRRM